MCGQGLRAAWEFSRERLEHTAPTGAGPFVNVEEHRPAGGDSFAGLRGFSSPEQLSKPPRGFGRGNAFGDHDPSRVAAGVGGEGGPGFR